MPLYVLRKKEQRISIHFEIGGIQNLKARNVELVTDAEKGILVLDLSSNYALAEDVNERIDAERLSDDRGLVVQLLFQEDAMLPDMHRLFARHPALRLEARLLLRDRERVTYAMDRPTEDVDWLAIRLIAG